MQEIQITFTVYIHVHVWFLTCMHYSDGCWWNSLKMSVMVAVNFKFVHTVWDIHGRQCMY